MIKHLHPTIIAVATLLQQVFSFHANAQAPCDSLLSPCVDTYSVNGYYLTLEAGAANTLIKSFSTITQNPGSRDVDIYYKAGTYLGFESNSVAWTLIGSTTGFNPLDALSCPIPQTKIPINVNFCIAAGQQYSFYIIRSNGSGTFEANKNYPEGTVAKTDGSLTLYSGKGTQDFSPFQGAFLRDSLSFQGTIDYSCGCTTTGIDLLNNKNTFSAYPIPASDNVNFNFISTISDAVIISISDVNGKVVQQEHQQIVTGTNRISINISHLSSGIYSAHLSGQRSILGKAAFTKQ